MQDAVSAGTTVSINGGKVGAEAKGDGSCAISGQTGVAVNGGEVSAYASGQKHLQENKYPYGISSPEGNIVTGENVKLTARGRHDPCIVPRALPCVESAAAIAIAELII